MEANLIKWLSKWFDSQCDGSWEHSNRLIIESIDNPGWNIQIDLQDTELENLEIKWTLVENNENDWYGFKVQNSRFSASGDTSKLELLITKFKELQSEKAANMP